MSDVARTPFSCRSFTRQRAGGASGVGQKRLCYGRQGSPGPHYAGLGTRVHDSGKTKRGGGITKYILSEVEGQGRRDLRRAMVEAAWAAVRSSKHWQTQFDKLAIRFARNFKILPLDSSAYR